MGKLYFSLICTIILGTMLVESLPQNTQPERHLLIRLPNDSRRQEAYLRDLPISAQDPNPEQKVKEIISRIDDANVKYLQRKIAKILEKNAGNQELQKYSKYYQIPQYQKLSYVKSPFGIRKKIVQEVSYSVPESQMFLNTNGRDSVPMFQESIEFVPLQNYDMEVGDLPEPVTYFMPPPVAILNNNNQQEFTEIFETEPVQRSPKPKESSKSEKSRRRGKSMRALFQQGHGAKHLNTNNGVEVSEFDGSETKLPMTVGEGKVFSLLPSRISSRIPKPSPNTEEATDEEDGDSKGIFNRPRPIALPQGPVKNSPAFYIHRLRVREGGLAIAGPGGIATAGRGGTAIVGPDGVAYATREGTAIAGPGASVVALSDGSNLNRLAEELSRKDINATQNENPTSKYLEGEYVSTGEGRNARKIFIPTGGKLVAKGPVIYHNTEKTETEDSTVAVEA